MTLFLKGRIWKEDQRWIAKIHSIDIYAEGPSALACIKNMVTNIKTEVKNDDLKCTIKVDDLNVFYFVTQKKSEMVEFIAERLVIKNNDIDLNNELKILMSIRPFEED